jgi:peptidoglycan/xylan/chitin deacetylase (PgdA/CDA1 family)
LSNNNLQPKQEEAIFVWEAEENVAALVRAENEKAQKENDGIKVFREEKRKNYMDMYPDMYVESVKPVILLEERQKAYLTFDDGPSHITKDIIDVLKEYQVKATFFILGSTMKEEEKEYLKQMVEDGHTIGIHTFSHNYKEIYSSVEAFLEDFYEDYKLIYDITGVQVNIFRFPWGSYNLYNKGIRDELIEEMERRGFTYYDWNVSAEDSVGNPTEYRIKQNVLKDLSRYKQPIILMHDSAINRLTARILPDIIKEMQDKGYVFDTLENREPYQFGNK